MAVTISEVSVSVWIVTIIFTFFTETVWFVMWVEVRLEFISNLSVGLDVSENWTSRVSVLVSSTDLSMTDLVASMSLSDDPGKFFPAFVLLGDKSNLISFTSGFVFSFLDILPVSEASLNLLTSVAEVIDQTSSGCIKLGLSVSVVSAKSSFL